MARAALRSSIEGRMRRVERRDRERAGEAGERSVNSSDEHYLGWRAGSDLDTARANMSEVIRGRSRQDEPLRNREGALPQPLRMADRPRRSGPPVDGGKDGAGTAVLTRTRTRKPNLYRVLLLNDDYTPMEFVVHVLERFFQKDRAAATQIMMHVHQNGVGECGVFTYEVAETKVTLVMDLARKHMHPLQCVMEKK
jgi:ATP-dependent Clp protease adaptor protein ClpS